MNQIFDYKAAATALTDKTILVTGAGGGIGRAAAMAFSQHGATVILTGSRATPLEQTYDQMVAAGCREPAMITFDLKNKDLEAYIEFANSIDRAFGKLDGVLHNASILGERKPIEQQTFSVWSEVMQVNVNSAMLMTKALMPLLRAASSASIVLTSSGVGRQGRAYWGAYAVSKFATEGLMQVLADEMQNTSNIRVNSVNPGGTRTAMRQSAFPGESPENNPLPDEIMPVYLYLMSDDSAEVNGQALSAQIR
ncbi:MAG: YciK family oxidoreductase [Pseudomonadota bacterium]